MNDEPREIGENKSTYIYERLLAKKMAKYKAQKMIVKPSGENGECITIVKGSKAKPKGLTKSQIKRIRIKERDKDDLGDVITSFEKDNMKNCCYVERQSFCI